MERTTAGSDSERQRSDRRRERDGGSSGGAGRGSVAALHGAVGNQAVGAADADVHRQVAATGADGRQSATADRDATDELCSRCARRYRAGKSLDCPDCEATLQRSVDLSARSETAGGVVQPKLTVSRRGDPAEREAERVADEVAGTNDSRDVAVSRRATGGGGGSVDGDTESRIRAATRGGRPLPEPARSTFESWFDRDFSDVRIHAGPRADAAARSIDAEAFTHGSDIVFARGNYRPNSAAGRQLLAHELTHVVQQQATVRPNRTVNRQEAESYSQKERQLAALGASSAADQEWEIDPFYAPDAYSGDSVRGDQEVDDLYTYKTIFIFNLPIGSITGRAVEKALEATDMDWPLQIPDTNIHQEYEEKVRYIEAIGYTDPVPFKRGSGEGNEALREARASTARTVVAKNIDVGYDATEQLRTYAPGHTGSDHLLRSETTVHQHVDLDYWRDKVPFDASEGTEGDRILKRMLDRSVVIYDGVFLAQSPEGRKADLIERTKNFLEKKPDSDDRSKAYFEILEAFGGGMNRPLKFWTETTVKQMVKDLQGDGSNDIWAYAIDFETFVREVLPQCGGPKDVVEKIDTIVDTLIDGRTAVNRLFQPQGLWVDGESFDCIDYGVGGTACGPWATKLRDEINERVNDPSTIYGILNEYNQL